MTYESKDKHLKISVRLFADDLEEALTAFTKGAKIDILGSPDWDQVNEYFSNYCQNHFEIRIGKKEKEYTFLGSELENDVLWAYLEIENLRSFKSISVTNSMLLEIFDDQENLVHVRKDGDDVRSLRLNRETASGLLEWNN